VIVDLMVLGCRSKAGGCETAESRDDLVGVRAEMVLCAATLVRNQRGLVA
jgi:hypothetical protein